MLQRVYLVLFGLVVLGSVFSSRLEAATTSGTWIDVYRQCVSAEEEAGATAREARSACQALWVKPQTPAEGALIQKTNAGTWIEVFRQCVSAEEEAGAKAREARSACQALWVEPQTPAEGALIQQTNTGTWIDVYRQCVSAEEEAGATAREARSACVVSALGSEREQDD